MVTELIFHVFSSRSTRDLKDNDGPSGYFLQPESHEKVADKIRAAERCNIQFFITSLSVFIVLTPHGLYTN